jgi:hypothetical protein
MNFIDANSNRQIEKQPHIFRRSLVRLLSVSILTMGFWINACNFGTAGPEPTAKPEKESNMENLQSNSSPKTSIPPIDAAMPARIETATFALG